MWAAKVQASLRIRAESQIPGPSEWLGITVKICHDGMLKDTDSLDAVQIES